MPGWNDVYDTRYWVQTGPNDFAPRNGEAYQDWLARGVDTTGNVPERPVAAPSGPYMGPMGGAPNANSLPQPILDKLYDNFIKGGPPMVNFGTGEVDNMRPDSSQGFTGNTWADPATGTLYIVPSGGAQGFMSITPKPGKDGPEALFGQELKSYDYNGNYLGSKTWDRTIPKWLTDKATQVVGTLVTGGMLGAAAMGALGAVGATEGAVAGGTGGLTTAEAAGVGSSVIPEGVAFVPATTAEMGAMGGLGAAGAGITAPGAAMGAGADFGSVLDLPGHELTNSLGELNGLEGTVGGLPDLTPTDLPGHDLSHVTGDFTSPLTPLPPNTGTLGAPPGTDPGVPPPANPFTNGSGLALPDGWQSLVTPALGLINGALQNNAANHAADAMRDAANAGIAEQRRQFDTVRGLLQPYVNSGYTNLNAYDALTGVSGAPAQQAALDALKAGPQFGTLVQQGEDAILQNAAATGGLRGGNTQDALAKYRTQVLSGLIDKQLGRYTTPMQLGQASAAGVGNAAMTTGSNVSNLMQQAGSAQAGGIVAANNAITNAIGGIGGFFAGQQASAPTAPAPVPTTANLPTNGLVPGFGSGIVAGYSQPTRMF